MGTISSTRTPARSSGGSAKFAKQLQRTLQNYFYYKILSVGAAGRQYTRRAQPGVCRRRPLDAWPRRLRSSNCWRHRAAAQAVRAEASRQAVCGSCNRTAAPLSRLYISTTRRKPTAVRTHAATAPRSTRMTCSRLTALPRTASSGAPTSTRPRHRRRARRAAALRSRSSSATPRAPSARPSVALATADQCHPPHPRLTP